MVPLLASLRVLSQPIPVWVVLTVSIVHEQKLVCLSVPLKSKSLGGEKVLKVLHDSDEKNLPRLKIAEF